MDAPESKTNQPPPSNAVPPPLTRLLLSAAWAIVVMSVGGYLTGMAVLYLRPSHLGILLVWPIGLAAGWVARRIAGSKSALVGWLLVAACWGATALATVCWLHWDFVDGAPSWWAAVRLLPRFAGSYHIFVALSILAASLGSVSAYRQAAARYRTVRVVMD